VTRVPEVGEQDLVLRPIHAATGGKVETDVRSSCDLAYREALLAILIDGSDVSGVQGDSVGRDQQTRELLNYSLELSDGRDRIVALANNKLRATLAVGRFVWMMAGSDRLDDIRFYESSGLAGDRSKGVSTFSDDGLSISGSNYGQRLFRPAPGVDQVESCIRLIRDDPVTRRAAMVIYRPEDAGRASHDIPCTFGTVLSPRDGRLHMTVIMRSNNAWVLLPFNIFEFTLLGEIIATETDLQLGAYHHFAVSMHLYEQHFEPAREAIGADALRLESFPEMPRQSLERVRQLCAWESSVRHRHQGLSKRDIQNELRALNTFGEFWAPFGRVILAKAALNAGKEEIASDIAAATRGPLGQLLQMELGLLDSPEMVESAIPAPASEFVEELHAKRAGPDPADRTTGRFYLMMMREQLGERDRRPSRK
jgi:thymidylate synthase